MADPYKQFFQEADKDGSGSLTLEELTNVMKSKGYKGSDADIRKMFNAVDASGDNKITMDEYLAAMGQVPPKDHKAASMRACFRSFDADGSGSIDRNELAKVFEEMGKSFTDDELKRMIALADKDNSGTLEYEEFIQQVFGGN